jgi:NAD(P)-dependent dehydrogenase (short-subunit alcohol dehydrogenase family)
MTDFSLEGKVAIVTGAAGGIGEAYARALAEAGAAVVAADVNAEAVAAVAERAGADGLNVVSAEVDVTDEASVAALAERARSDFGGIDVLVNNAALMMQIPREGLVDFPLDWWDRVLRVNVTGPLLCVRACVPSMIERGGGSIVNQSSAAAYYNWRPYGISKLALLGLTYGLAQDLGKHGIRVNAIAPGTMETAAVKDAVADTPGWWEQRAALAALGTTGDPRDLCGALVYLASDASRWTTGQTLNVDGGWIIRP